jgi:hypothetical protein
LFVDVIDITVPVAETMLLKPRQFILYIYNRNI